MKVTKADILELQRKIEKINSVDLSEIETDIKITDSLEDLRFTGLDNFSILKMYVEEKQKEGLSDVYNKRVWLNPSTSSSTGSIVCFSGLANWTEAGSDKPAKSRFVEIADCHNKVRIHQGERDSLYSFIDKIELIKQTLDEYQCFLQKEKEGLSDEKNKPSKA